jgi:hypothetical protein
VDVGTSLSLITKRNQRTDGSSISPDVITIGAEGATTVIGNTSMNGSIDINTLGTGITTMGSTNSSTVVKGNMNVTGNFKTEVIEGISTTGTQSLYATKTAGNLAVLGTGTGTMTVNGSGIVAAKIDMIDPTVGRLDIAPNQIGGIVTIGDNILRTGLVYIGNNGTGGIQIGAGSTGPITLGKSGSTVNMAGLATLSGGLTMNSSIFFTAAYAASAFSESIFFTNTGFGQIHMRSIIGGVGTEAVHSRFRFDNGSRECLNINITSGKVGINNVANPGADLDVNGFLRYVTIGQNSDRRIKKNIVDIDDMSALTILRKLKPKTYEYIDQEKRTDKVVFGFIAQDVKEELDYAVSQLTDPVPNIFSEATVTNDMITFTTYDTSNLLRDASNNLLKLVIKTKTIYEYANIVEVIDEYTLRTDRDLLYLCENGTLFVYGQEVNDFHILNKEVIWTVATAALQEVDRQLQAEKQKTALMQTALDALLERVIALEQKTSV